MKLLLTKVSLLTTTIGHDSSSELEEETQAGPAIQLTHNQTRLDRLQGLQGDIADLCSRLKWHLGWWKICISQIEIFIGFIFHFSSHQNPSHSHHRFDTCNSRRWRFKKLFSVYFNFRCLTAKGLEVLHSVALAICSSPVWKTLLCVTCDSMGGPPIQNAPDVGVQSLQIF